MFKRQLVSVLVALSLAAGAFVVPLNAYGFAPFDDDEATILVAPEDGAAGEARPAKRKGNGFVRAITAPFRALGRLFSGGKKKSEEAAKARAKSEEKSKQREAAKAAERSKDKTNSGEAAKTGDDAAKVDDNLAASAPAAEKPADTPARVKKEKKKKREPKSAESVEAGRAPGESNAASGETVKPASAVPASAAPIAAARAPVVAPVAQPGVRVIRPSEVGAAAAAAQPRMWIPYIEGVAKHPLSQGRALLLQGYLNEAVSELSVAATVGPDFLEANNLLGVALDRAGRHDEAVEAYERALSIDPANAQVLNNIGYSLYLADKHADAMKRLRQAARLAPGSPDILNNIGLVQARLGKYGDAFKSFTLAVGEYQARVKVGELLEAAGRVSEAVKHYEAALRVEPASPALLERLADLYERTGRAREAEAARRRAGEQPNKQKTATGGGGGG